MARQSRPSFKKRQKEVARQQKRQAKVAQRAEKSELKNSRPAPIEGDDPEIAGIRPGPQPPPDWMQSDTRKS